MGPEKITNTYFAAYSLRRESEDKLTTLAGEIPKDDSFDPDDIDRESNPKPSEGESQDRIAVTSLKYPKIVPELLYVCL